jgi:signal transduction histidine kinase
MLKSLADAAHGYGCILWQQAPDLNFAYNPPGEYLFVLADWFRDSEKCPMHDVPLTGSATGSAIRSGKTINIKDIWESEIVYLSHPFLKRAGITSLCSVPINFRDNSRGAVNLYRRRAGYGDKEKTTPFNDEEIARIEDMVQMVPYLYQAIRDEVSLKLIGDINQELHKAELATSDPLLLKDSIKDVFNRICEHVSKSFRCIETSIFLEDRLQAPGTYELMATTWPGFYKKTRYLPEAAEGLTGWVLKHAEPVKLFDLANFANDIENIQRRYEDIVWSDGFSFNNTVHEILGIALSDDLPPLSYMAAPIASDKKVLGVIRCSLAKDGPYYFAQRDLDLLALVADQISRYWSNWLRRCEEQEEIQSWQAVVESIGKLNSFVHTEVIRDKPDERRIFAEALKITSTVIGAAEIMDIRLYDEQKQDLYFAEIHGKFWNEGNKKEIQARKEKRFPIGEKSAGAYVFRQGEVLIMDDVKKDEHYSGTFADTKRMIVAPIKVEDKKYGVLDIRGTGERNFPKHAKAVAELLGQQLGLYRYLAATIAQLRDALDALESMRVEHIQSFEDLGHQLRSPIYQAHHRVQLALSKAEPESEVESYLFAIRGLFSKAKRVSLSTRLFSELAGGNPITAEPSHLQADSLVKMLIEAAVDIKLLINPSRYVKFHVEAQSFDLLKYTPVKADTKLLEQAITNILDNAGKYSFSNTTVRIHGGLTKSGQFHITVANKGLAISSDEVSSCIERGWRSEDAERTTGEGSGIGLWIVNHIMKAHQGNLIIEPTDANKITKVKLVFPTSKS